MPVVAPGCCGECWEDLGCTCVACACGHCLCAHEKHRFHRICRCCTPLEYSVQVGDGPDGPTELGDWDDPAFSDRYSAELARHRPID